MVSLSRKSDDSIVVVRTGWDCEDCDHERHADWCNAFEKELYHQCEHHGLDIDDCDISITELTNVYEDDPKEYARKIVKKTLHTLRMI